MKKPPSGGFGGLYWTRTSDPIDVNDVLYQLSQQTITILVTLPVRPTNWANRPGFYKHSDTII